MADGWRESKALSLSQVLLTRSSFCCQVRSSYRCAPPFWTEAVT